MIRDVGSNAVLSTDKVALDKYRLEKQRIKQIDQIRKDVSDLKDTVCQLRLVVEKLIEEKV